MNIDPRNYGLLGMAGAMLTPGGGLGQGFTAFQQGMGQGVQLQGIQQRNQILAQQAQMQQAEFAAQQRAAQQQQDAMRRLMGMPSSPGEGWSPEKVQLAYLAGLKPEQVTQMAGARDLGRPEVARTLETTDAFGRPVTTSRDKFNRPIGGDVAKPYEMKYQDLGGKVQAVDPYLNVQAGDGFAKTNTPESILSAETARRGQNMTDARAREFNAIQRETNATNKALAASAKQTDSVDSMRKEFAALPEVKAIKEIIPAQQSATDAIKRDTAQADINLIYATAKIFDPTSVVREGEYATVNNSQPPAERFQGLISHLTGGGKLTPATRRALLAEVNSRANAAKGSYDAARTAYGEVAQRRGYNERDVFPELPSLATPDVAAPRGGLPSSSDIDAELKRRGIR